MSIVEVIHHYQKSIDNSLDNEARLIHCLGKLHRLPISVQHLQDTGIGRTVNGLRKYDGEVGVAARTLVMKWKALVAVEETESDEEMESDEVHDDADHGGANGSEYDYEAPNLQVDEQASVEQQEEESDDHDDDQMNGNDSDHPESDHYAHQDRHTDDVDQNLRPSKETEASSSRDSHSGRTHSKEHKSRDRRDKHRSESGKESSHRSSSKSHSSSSSSRKSSSSHGEKDGKNKHGDSSKSSGKRESSHSSRSESRSIKSESSHSSSKIGSDSKNKHHSSSKVSKEASNEHRKEEEDQKHRRSSEERSSKDRYSSKDKHRSSSKVLKEDVHEHRSENDRHKRRRSSEEEEISDSKRAKSSDKNKSSSSSSSRRDKSSSSKSSSSGVKEHSKSKESSEKKKKSSSEKKNEDLENSDDDNTIGLDSSGGASFADALSMIGMPSSSKKKSSKTSTDKGKQTSSSMPPPASKARDDKLSSKSAKGSSSRDAFSPNSTASSSSYSSTSSSNYSSTPLLLAQKAKLEPLPQASEIVEALPVISPHYKPMPLNQTVMECVFSNNGKTQKRPLTEEEALGQSMQSKNMRTKVYSGVKNTKGGVPRLYDLCIRLLQENIDLLDVTGGIPFDLLRPVLERATPEQLFNLENYNPYLMEDTDVLWEQHCRRQFRSQQRKEDECESWREMFVRCLEERDAKLKSLTHHIKLTQVEKAAPVRRTQLAFADAVVKPPRNVLSKQAKYGTDRLPVVSPAARVASLNNLTKNVAKAGDSRLKVAPGVRDTAQVQVFQPVKPRKAPLMAKLMTSLKGFKTGFRR